jgi:hypothetical protein
MFTFRSIGHFFAKAFHAIAKAEPKVEAELEAVAATKPVVEGVTDAVAPGLVPLEDAAYAVLGAVVAALHAGGDAAKAKLADAGLDVTAIQKAEAAYASVPQLAALAKTL